MPSLFPIQVTDTVRVDAGPAIKSAIANDRTMSDTVTAGHYKYGRVDAYGNPIVKGKKFHYVDWLASEDDYVYSVYQHDGERYQLISRHATDVEALEVAENLGG